EADQASGSQVSQPQACQAQPAGAKSLASCSSGRPASVLATPMFLAARPVQGGGTASVSVHASPGTTCSLQYRAPNAGAWASIGQQTAGADGLMTWTFPAGNQTGVGNLQATCGELS